MDADIFAAVSAAEENLDRLSSWLFWATLAVVIGLAVEYAPTVRKLINRRASHWPERRELWFELVGGILITLGVAGELIIQFKGGRQETALRKSNHEYVLLLNGRVAKASKDAANAG
jgi:hypothetical protein